MRSVSLYAAVVLALVCFAPRAYASPITYQISGVASGQIGGSTFTDADVVFTGTGDTANVVDLFGGIFFANPLDSLTVSIESIGIATLTEAAEIVGLPTAVIDPEIPPFPLVLFGRTDDPPDLSSITGIAGVASDALSGYELKTAFAPLTDLGGVGLFPSECGTPGHDSCLQTTLGVLSFVESDFEARGATFVATTAVPEPATLLLMSGGLAAFVRRSRARQRG
jgi:hypothetical protein